MAAVSGLTETSELTKSLTHPCCFHEHVIGQLIGSELAIVELGSTESPTIPLKFGTGVPFVRLVRQTGFGS
jgi:hypothetical protein